MGYRPNSQNPRPSTTPHRVEPVYLARSSCGLDVVVGVQTPSYRLGKSITRFMTLEIVGREITAVPIVKEGLVDLPDVKDDDLTDTSVVHPPSTALKI